MPVIAAGIGIVVLAVVGLIALGLMTSGGSSSNELATKIEESASDLPAQNGLSLGSADAPLVLEVFEDFQCPFCIRFTADVEPALIDEYVSTGKVRLDFQNFAILGLESEAAARAMVCAAEQNRAWNYGIALYALQANANQVEVERLNVGRFDRDALVEVARDVGLNSAFNTCFDSGASGQAVLDQQAKGSSLGVKGTPGFALNGKLIVNPPGDIAGWRTLLDQQLAATGQ